VSEHKIKVTVNGFNHHATVEARLTLGDFLRVNCGYTGTHLACEHGVCGACTVIVDGLAVRSCLLLAVQADGSEVTTVEGVAAPDGTLHPVQQAMRDNHALQCGFCTPGIVMTFAELHQGEERPTEEAMLDALSGHLCRCTGYQGLKRAIRQLAGKNTEVAGDH
jgi:carbon-monoxide dehydrogenase small subunit